MYQDKIVLCGASAYEQKYYFNQDFSSLPDAVKQELQIMCVLYTEDIGSVLKIKQIQSEKRELLESLEMYYRVFFLGEAPEDEKTEDKSEDSEGKAVDSVENGD